MLTCRSGDDETSVTKQHSKVFVTSSCKNVTTPPAKFTAVREVVHVSINPLNSVTIYIWSHYPVVAATIYIYAHDKFMRFPHEAKKLNEI